VALTPRYLADKSALARMPHVAVNAVLGPLILAGEVATCGIIDLEVFFSARSHADFVQTRAWREQAFARIAMEQSDFDRAVEVMEVLARHGQHRAVALPDLLIAAVAERAGLCVLHYDEDYDRIAAVTGQSVQWVVPRGSA
jgi:predicted nucleic acid-binding protein